MQKTDECVNPSDFLSTSQLEAFDLIKAFVRACVSVCVRAEDNETHRRRTEEIVTTALVRMWIHYCVTLSHTHPSLPQDSSVACTVKVWVCAGVFVCLGYKPDAACWERHDCLAQRDEHHLEKRKTETETEYHNISNKLSLEAGTAGHHFQGKVSRR